MFHIFENKEDRRQFGGSAFIEIQYCRLSSNTKLKKIVSVNSIRNWVEDSLYIFVDDIDSFIDSYGSIFNMGTYNNVKKGSIDVFGINYYTSDDVKKIVDTITNEKPIDYQILLNWLSKATQYNGIYILGI